MPISKKLEKKPLNELRRLANEAASLVSVLDADKTETRNQEAIDQTAKYLAYVVSVIDMKLAKKKNKKYSY